MKTNAVQFAAGLALVAFGAPFPAFGQYFPPPLIVVPPQAQEYARPRPAPDHHRRPNQGRQATMRPRRRNRRGTTEGRTYVPD